MKRTKLLAAAAFAVLAVLQAGPGFCAQKMAAVAVFVEGDVQVTRSGVKEAAELKVNDALYPGDALKTAAGAKASLVSKGGAELRVNENSTFEIPGKKEKANTFKLMAGQMWSRMLHKMAKLNVRTPSAVCAIRGTEADIEQRDIMTVKVYEGHVDLTNKAGKQSLKAGQISTVSGAAAPTAPRKMKDSEKGTWHEGIDVKDIGNYLATVDPKGAKKLKVKVNKDGAAKNMEIKLKPK